MNFGEYVEVIETDEGPKFRFGEHRLSDVDRAIKGIPQGNHGLIQEIGRHAGATVMQRLLPDGTVGQTVDVLLSLMEDYDPIPSGWGSPATHLLETGVTEALRVAAEYRQAHPAG